MPEPFKPDMSRHSQVVDLGSKEDADSYVEAGWEFIGTRTGLIAKDRAILTYRLGWPLGAGDPVHPRRLTPSVHRRTRDIQQIDLERQMST